MIHFTNVTKKHGSQALFNDASFQLNKDERVGLVGPNGAGKTTVFRLIMGEESADEGQISMSDRTVIGYFSQDIEQMRGRSVLEEVMASAGRVSEIQKRMAPLELKLSEPMSEDEMEKTLHEYGQLQSEFEQLGGYDLEVRAKEIITGLGFPPEDHGRLIDHYSGGWKMRIKLAKILILNPDVLLMDEPTNHLDYESIVWLEAWLQEFQGSLLMTSHDRDFMNRTVRKIVEVAYRTITTYSGNYDFYEKEREVRKAQLIASAKRQQEMLAKEEEFIARFAARASHAAQVQSRVKKLEKIVRIEVPPEERAIKFEWPVPPRSGDDVVRLEDVTKVWRSPDGREIEVFRGASALVQRGDRVAVVGVNGAGKSSLLKLVAGHTEATSGEVTIGSAVEIGYFSQDTQDVLDPNRTILEEVESRVPTSTVGYVRNLLGAFKFSGDEVKKKISVLSGGEKSRVVLATILARPVNLLILDEPTNHLDIASREVLLEAIKNFPGTVMIVSHDRYFLREMTTRVFRLDRHELTVTNGSWDYYLELQSEQA